MFEVGVVVKNCTSDHHQSLLLYYTVYRRYVVVMLGYRVTKKWNWKADKKNVEYLRTYRSSYSVILSHVENWLAVNTVLLLEPYYSCRI